MPVTNVKALERRLKDIANEHVDAAELKAEYNSMFFQGKHDGRIQLAREILDEFFEDSEIGQRS